MIITIKVRIKSDSSITKSLDSSSISIMLIKVIMIGEWKTTCTCMCFRCPFITTFSVLINCNFLFQDIMLTLLSQDIIHFLTHCTSYWGISVLANKYNKSLKPLDEKVKIGVNSLLQMAQHHSQSFCIFCKLEHRKPKWYTQTLLVHPF